MLERRAPLNHSHLYCVVGVDNSVFLIHFLESCHSPVFPGSADTLAVLLEHTFKAMH